MLSLLAADVARDRVGALVAKKGVLATKVSTADALALYLGMLGDVVSTEIVRAGKRLGTLFA